MGGFMTGGGGVGGGVRPDERALKLLSQERRFFRFYRGQPLHL